MPPSTLHDDNIEWKSGTVTGSNLKSKKHIKLSDGNQNDKWISRRKPSITPTSNLARKYEEVADIKKN